MIISDCGLTLVGIESTGLTTASGRGNFSLELRFAGRGGKQETTARSLSVTGGMVDAVEESEGGADKGPDAQGLTNSSARTEGTAVEGGSNKGCTSPSCLRRFPGGKTKS